MYYFEIAVSFGISLSEEHTVQEMFQMGPKDPAAGMPARKLPQEPVGFADAWDAAQLKCQPSRTC